MKETIKRAFLWAVVFLGTILFWFIWYSAWTNLIADIPNQNSWDIMTSAIWNNLVDKLNKTIDNVNLLNTSISNINSVPTWAVMAFNLSVCPTWWTAANWNNWTPDLRWEFIRWLDSWRWVDSWRTLASLQRWSLVMNDSNNTDNRVFNLIHQWDNRLWYDNSITDSTKPYYRSQYQRVTSITQTWWTNWSVDTNYVWMTRPRNVALLYCIKN